MKTLLALTAVMALICGAATADERRCQGYQEGSPRAKQPGGYLNAGCPHFENVGGVTKTVDPYNLNSKAYWNQAPNNKVGADANQAK